MTTNCMLRCVMCEHTYWNIPRYDMTFEQFEKLLNQFPKLKWIGLTGIGESFLNKDFLRILELVKKRGIFVELYDNFFLIDERVSQRLVELEVDRILISMESCTKETYEKIRVGSNFDRVVTNIKRLFEIKKERGAHFPEVDFHYILMSNNAHEALPYLDLVHEITRGEPVSVQYSRMLHNFPEVANLFVEVAPSVIEQIARRGKELGISVHWNADIPGCKPSAKKCTEWIMPFIFANGEITPCCALNEEGDREFQLRTSMGSIFSQDFQDIWSGERYRNLREGLATGRIPAPCVRCPLYEIKVK